jgi:hypothetical protein
LSASESSTDSRLNILNMLRSLIGENPLSVLSDDARAAAVSASITNGRQLRISASHPGPG